MTEVLKGAALGAVVGAVDAGAKAAGIDSENQLKANASKAAKSALKPASSSSQNKTPANKKPKKS